MMLAYWITFALTAAGIVAAAVLLVLAEWRESRSRRARRRDRRERRAGFAQYPAGQEPFPHELLAGDLRRVQGRAARTREPAGADPVARRQAQAGARTLRRRGRGAGHAGRRRWPR